jgi:dinuclear metal center YbgI/SA1388 family protein
MVGRLFSSAVPPLDRQMSCTRQDLRAYLDTLLSPENYRDYCPNGLQVEGKAQIRHLVTGVTACQALINAAIEAEADAILVHHGFFWRSEDAVLVGMKARRLRTLMLNDINLFAYHLPLDCHPELGNNAQLGRLMGLSGIAPLAPSEPSLPVFSGALEEATSLSSFAENLSTQLGRELLTVGDGAVRSVAWCTGAGQHYIDTAADAGVDLYVTGEVSEQTIHIARERGISFIAAGHHATERYGAAAVGIQAGRELGCSHQFIDIDNPA